MNAGSIAAYMPTKKSLDNLSYEVIGAAIEVHKAVGPGLIEGVLSRVSKTRAYP